MAIRLKQSNSQVAIIPGVSDSTPLAAGSASAGTSLDAARADHVHPAQTNIAGNAGTATTLETSRNINGTSFNGSSAITTDKWGKARNIQIEDSDGSNISVAVSVDGSGAVTLKLPSIIKAQAFIGLLLSRRVEADISNVGGITAGTTVTVPEYYVGYGQINLFINGAKCKRGDTFSEVGTDGNTSTTITINDAIPAGYAVEVVVG